MTLSCAIMAHPDRKPYVDELLLQLNSAVPISWDGAGEPSAIGEQRWKVGREAWQMFASGADWHVVLQDDAIVCDDFLAGFAKALEHVPEQALVASAYCGAKRPGQIPFTRIAKTARNDGASWLRSMQVWWGVAIAARTETIEPMLEWCDTKIGSPYDSRIGAYYRWKAGSDAWFTWPSLVDHRDGPSLIAGHRDVGRNAREFHKGSALDLTWDGPVVDDPRMRKYDLKRRAVAR